MSQPRFAAALGLSLLFTGSLIAADDKSPARGDERRAAGSGAEAGVDAPAPTDPDAFLKSKGLKRSDPFFVLTDESDLNKRMAGLDRLKKNVTDGQKQEARAEKDEADKKEAIVECLKKRSALREQLAKNPPANLYNRIVTQINQLGDQAVLLEKEVNDNSPVKAAQGAANKSREAYIQQLLEIRQTVGRLQEKYADLAADQKVGEAIEGFNKAHGKSLKLGPSPAFASNDRKLKKFEETVLSDAIDIRRNGGQLWEVSVVFNGKEPQILEVDTGASIVCLSYQAATAAGLTPSETDPTLKMQLADGRLVEAKKVVAGSIRVGKFELEKVDVAVMPKSLVNASSLLGQTFLRHFSYKIDPEKSKLVMTKIDAAPLAAAATKPKSGSN